MRPALLLFALLAALGVADTAEAQQVEFKRVIRSGEERLYYRWRDHGRQEFNTSFTLAREAVRQAEGSFREFSLEAMWRVIEADMRDEVAASGQGARVDLRRSGNRMDWNIEGRDQASVDALGRRLLDRLSASQDAFLSRHLRRKVDDRRIMVDFAAAVRTLQEPMRAAAWALGEDRIGITDRARVAHALAFIQAIPYAVLDDPARQGGDFLPAPALLSQNRGDCDSKAVALAALLRTFVPARKLAVVTMPGHAILAIDLPPEPGERTILVSGRVLVVLEAAGPVLIPIGQVDANSERLLGSRDVEFWPVN